MLVDWTRSPRSQGVTCKGLRAVVMIGYQTIIIWSYCYYITFVLWYIRICLFVEMFVIYVCVCVCVCLCVCLCVYIYIYVCIYIYIERERERERESYNITNRVTQQFSKMFGRITAFFRQWPMQTFFFYIVLVCSRNKSHSRVQDATKCMQSVAYSMCSLLRYWAPKVLQPPSNTDHLSLINAHVLHHN